MPANNRCHVDTPHSTNTARAIRLLAAIGLICASVLPGSLSAAYAGALPSPTLTPVPAASPTSTPLPGYIPHRIGVRQVDGAGEFYDRQTGEKFVPRGYNYVRLSPINGTSGQPWEETLNPGFYDPVLAEEALRQMHTDGYNVVRVVVDCCRPGSNIGSARDGISAAYLDNVIDFLNRAKTHDIFVILVLHLTPAEGPYNERWYSYPKTVFDALNLIYLTPGGLDAKAWYDQDFIRALIQREAPLDAILAYDLTDGLYFDTGYPPFTLQRGQVTTANGETYDMAKPEDRQRMMEESLVSWIDQQRAAILEVDPTALVTQSVWVFRPDSRPTQPEAVWRSTADFVDLQVFVGLGRDWSDYERLFDEVERAANRGMDEKPVVIGKLGAVGYASGPSAARALVQWQSASCQHGVDGWLLADYLRLSSDREIDDALAPVNRPDACQPLSIRESVLGYLVFLPMGLASAAVLIALVYTARSRSRRISTVAGFLLAAPCALMGVLISGFVFSQLVGSLLCGLPPLVFGAGLGYLLGKRWEASQNRAGLTNSTRDKEAI